MEPLNIKTEHFEGPLALLLFLIKKLEIDIADIPITEVVEQYMTYLHSMKELKLDIAGDYLVMAATLLSIKSAMLLPRSDSNKEEDPLEEDPRSELVDMLREYERYQEAAKNLSTKEYDRQQYFTKPANEVGMYQELVPLAPGDVSLFDLLVAFRQVSLKKEYNDPPERTITREKISVEEKLAWMKNKIFASSGPLFFSELVSGNSKTELITAFLALLELIKEEHVIAYQESIQDELVLTIGKHARNGETLT